MTTSDHTKKLTIIQGNPAPSQISAANSAASARSTAPTPASPSQGPAAPPISSVGGASSGAALLADLNRGGSVTSGLRKVDPSQMTHKNPELRSKAGGLDAESSGSFATKARTSAVTQTPKKPPKMELEDGNKWIVVSGSAIIGSSRPKAFGLWLGFS